MSDDEELRDENPGDERPGDEPQDFSQVPEAAFEDSTTDNVDPPDDMPEEPAAAPLEIDQTTEPPFAPAVLTTPADLIAPESDPPLESPPRGRQIYVGYLPRSRASSAPDEPPAIEGGASHAAENLAGTSPDLFPPEHRGVEPADLVFPTRSEAA